MTSVATLNMLHSNSVGQMKQDLGKVLSAGADVIQMQEVSRARAKQLREYFARQGYGLIIGAGGQPIAYKLDKFKLANHGDQQLSGRTAVGPQGRGGNIARPVRASWAALVDKDSGETNVFVNNHFIAHASTSPNRAKIWGKDVRAEAALQRQLEKRYGKSSNYFMSGDLNQSNYRALRRLRHGDFNTYRANHPTRGRRGYIDWIASNNGISRQQVIRGLHSDHNAYIAEFGDKPGHGPNHDPSGGPVRFGDPHAPGPRPQTPSSNPPGGGGGGPKGGAFQYFSDLLESWGVPVGSDIEAIIKRAVTDGITPDQIGLLIPEIQQTQSWKTRFPGWEARIKSGHNQISVDEYLQLEDQYHQIMQQAGLPSGFYDDPSDFGNWIANDVSPDEIQNRVGLAVDAAKQVDPTMRNLMARYYGLTPGDVASFFLDQKRALPVIERQYNAAGVAAWASRNGLNVDDMKRFEGLVDSGVTIDQAAAGYGTVAALTDTVGKAAGIYGSSYNQSDAESDVFFNKSEKRQRIMANEQATFGGSSSGSTGSAKRQSY